MIYAFDEYTLDARLYELRGTSTPLQLEPFGFELLVYVVQHRDRIVTKHELRAHLWLSQGIGETSC